MKTLSLVLTVLALSGSAHAQITVEPDPDAGSTSVYVPANPGGVDICRDFIESRLNAHGQVTLSGRTVENMAFMLRGKKVGQMTYNDDGSQRALCVLLR